MSLTLRQEMQLILSLATYDSLANKEKTLIAILNAVRVSPAPDQPGCWAAGLIRSLVLSSTLINFISLLFLVAPGKLCRRLLSTFITKMRCW
eukprot:scaffold66245_cov18-Tisochrysis_lutea.AAC.1